MSDEDMLSALMFDIRFQYALHTTSFLEQPMSDRTLGRFRERCSAYEKETGIDLLHDTITSLSGEMAQMMELDLSLKRMDSLMVASNIKRMSRLEVLYTCVANLAKEVAGKEDSIVTDYQYKQNTHNDSQFLKDYLEKESVHTEPAVIVTDGAYCGTANEELAAGKNVQLVTTNLTGREAQDIAADFGFNEDGTKVEKCAGGFEPKSCCYNPRTGQCTASFQRSQCGQCPHKAQCRPKTFKPTCRKTISVSTKRRAEQQRYRGTKLI